jgi:hypothetical protein
MSTESKTDMLKPAVKNIGYEESIDLLDEFQSFVINENEKGDSNFNQIYPRLDEYFDQFYSGLDEYYHDHYNSCLILVKLFQESVDNPDDMETASVDLFLRRIEPEDGFLTMFPKKNEISLEKADTLRKLISIIRSLPDNLTVEEVFDSLFEVKPQTTSSTPDWKTAVKKSKTLFFNEYYGEFTVKTDTDTFFFYLSEKDDPESDPVKNKIEVPLYKENEILDLQNTILLLVSGEDSKLEELEYVSRFPNEIR